MTMARATMKLASKPFCMWCHSELPEEDREAWYRHFASWHRTGYYFVGFNDGDTTAEGYSVRAPSATPAPAATPPLGQVATMAGETRFAYDTLLAEAHLFATEIVTLRGSDPEAPQGHSRRAGDQR